MYLRLRIAAVAIIVVGIAVGVGLILTHGRVLFTAGDCLPPAGYTGGGYRCYVMGHPHAPLGLTIILGSAVAFAVLWLLSYRRSRIAA